MTDPLVTCAPVPCAKSVSVAKVKEHAGRQARWLPTEGTAVELGLSTQKRKPFVVLLSMER